MKSTAPSSASMDLRRVSRAVRALRMRRGWRQADLAREARLSRSIVGRIERGEHDGLTIDAVVAVAEALGATVQLELRWQGEGLDRLLDEGHATLVDRVVRGSGAGWEVAVEVSFASGGERGSIDVLAWHPVRHALGSSRSQQTASSASRPNDEPARPVRPVKSVTPDCRRCSTASTGRRGSDPSSRAVAAGTCARRRACSWSGTRGPTGGGSRPTPRRSARRCQPGPAECSPGSEIRSGRRRRASGS